MKRQPRDRNETHLAFIRTLPTAERVRELLDYNWETGEFRWRMFRGGTTKIGSLAGWTTQHGYRAVSIDCRKYYAHRLAIVWTHGFWVPDCVDHINGDRGDNRIANLRPANVSQNMANARKRKDNKSGYKGVSWNRRDKRWCSFIRRNGKTVGLGSFKTAEEAYAAYCAAAAENYGRFWSAA